MIRTTTLAGSLGALALASGACAQNRILIDGARVFDGTGAAARVADVLLEGERIVAVERDIALPAGASRVDGRGKTLIPGLHDLHTHTRATGYGGPEDQPKAWAGYLLAGVTTIDDFSVSGEMIAPIRSLVKEHGFWAPNLNQAVRFAVNGGHGTEAGWGPFMTLEADTARAAHRATPLALSYDPDLIKVFTDGWRYGRDPDLNSMNLSTLSAIVEDAHKAGRPVVSHTVTLDGAKVASAAGVDALGHGIGDAPADAELTALMREKRTAYIATMAVYEPKEARMLAPGEAALLNPGERAREAAADAENSGKVEPYNAARWAILQDNMRRLKKAKIRIGVGTDAGIGGTYHGTSAVRETILLTRLGFTPVEALVAATRASAAIIGQDDTHGTIRPGMRADLVLIDGQPDKRIGDLWNARRVWVAGREAPLEKLRALRDNPGMTPLPVIPMPGPVLTAARADGRTDLGTLPVPSTDPGIDHSHLVAHRGDAGEPTFLAAQMGAAPQPYVQWVLPLTRGPILVADASRFTGIELTATGPGDYRLVLESYGLDGREWFAAPFAAGDKPARIRLPFAAFTSRDATARLDLTQLRALRVQLSAATGATATLEVGEVRFY
jgi:imidazolonepropionase-like amidohydrolase